MRPLVLSLLLAGSALQDGPLGRVDAACVRAKESWTVAVRGAATLPDRAELRVMIAAVREGFDQARWAIAPAESAEAPKSSRVAVQKKAYSASFANLPVGTYEISVQFDPKIQPKALADSLAGMTGPTRVRQAAVVGDPAAVLKWVSAHSDYARAALARASELLAVDGDQLPPPEPLKKWFEEHRDRCADPRLAATTNHLRDGVRGYAIWGKGKRGEDQTEEGARSTTSEEIASFLSVNRQLLARERALWDVKLARTLISAVGAAAAEAEPAKAVERIQADQEAGWTALSEGLGEDRLRELESIDKGLGAALGELILKGREFSEEAGEDPAAVLERAGELQSLAEKVEVRMRTLTKAAKKK